MLYGIHRLLILDLTNSLDFERITEGWSTCGCFIWNQEFDLSYNKRNFYDFGPCMCLIVFGWQVKRGTPLIVAANRDEFYARPALPAHHWEDAPFIFAGKDLEGGGTWLGVSESDQGFRFAALTNVRAPALMKEDAPTRGLLVSNFLSSSVEPKAYVDELKKIDHLYNGFNLLVGDKSSLIWYSNFGHDNPLNGVPLLPGFYGVSNALLNTSWPKLTKASVQFEALVTENADMDQYFDMLSDTQTAPDDQLPETGVSYEWEKMLSAICIKSQDYGTRVSTYVEINHGIPPILHERIIHP